MKWIAACLHNKLIVYIIAIACCFAGLVALSSRPLSPFPEIPINGIFFTIEYPGANAQTVQKQVTSEVISRLQSLQNVQYITSYTQASAANIYIRLADSVTPLDKIKAQLQIIQAINSAHLPSSVPQPTITVAAGTSGLIQFVVSSNELSLFQIDNFILSNLNPKFSSLPGVLIDSDDFDPTIKIKLKPEMLAQYQLNPSDIQDTINSNYQASPLGSLYIQSQQYLLNTTDNYNSLNALENLIIGYRAASYSSNLVQALQATTQAGLPIYLKDIAELSFEPRNISDQPYVNFNGKLAAQTMLITRTIANPFSVSKITRDYVNSIQSTLPADMMITPLYDVAKIMMSAIHDVTFTLILSSLLVLLVALVFLGRLKTTLIPIITVPVCLLGAIICMTALDFSINLLTLLAMVIAVGLVVDDAIVVVENIIRYIEKGQSKKQAVLEGTSNIALTVVGITLTLLAVYMPIIFSGGVISSLLKPFALTLASAVFISGIVALTLTPVMALTFIDDHKPNNYQIWFERMLHNIIDGYQYFLKKVFKNPIVSLSVVIALIIFGSYYAMQLPKMVFAPDPDGMVSITMQAAPEDNIDSLKQKIQQFSQFYQDKKLAYYIISSSKDEDTGILSMKVQMQYKDQYLKKLLGYAESINDYIKQHNIKNTTANMNQFMNWGSDNYDIAFYLYGGSDPAIVDSKAQQISNVLSKSAVFFNVHNAINLPQKQLAFNIDTVAAQQLGISRQQIVQLLSTVYGGAQMNNNFSIAGLSVPILMQINNESLADPQSFQKLMIQSPTTNQYYPLGDFITLQTIAKPLAITTFNNQPAVEIEAKLNKGYDMNAGITAINAIMHSQAANFQHQYIGSALSYLESNNETLMIGLLGILCVYFLLAILFKSLIDPFIILLTVPFSVIGGALSLYLIHGSLNIFSILGLITLIGLITKHGVLIVQFANAELKAGISAVEAMLLATRYRFRPILMTTLAMMLGALPLLLSHDIMYVSRQNLAIVIVGGLAVGTLFSLFIVPLVYVLIKQKA